MRTPREESAYTANYAEIENAFGTELGVVDESVERLQPRAMSHEIVR
jgi:hypothetical protein